MLLDYESYATIFFKALVYGLITKGLVDLIVFQEGIFRIFVRFRTVIGIEANVDWDDLNELQKIFSCPWCLFFWLSGLLVFFAPHSDTFGFREFILVWFTAYSISIFSLTQTNA